MKNDADKLTLKLKRASIKRAKAYAKDRGTSLSKLVEGYFDQISPAAPLAAEEGITDNIRALMGIIQVPDDFDARKEYREHIIRKYSR